MDKGGNLQIVGGIRNQPGKSCKNNVLFGGASGVPINLNGRPHDLNILVHFDGCGGFRALFRLDGKLFADVRYKPTSSPGQKPAEVLYFKHGVYSSEFFNFTMKSTGMSVRSMDGKI